MLCSVMCCVVQCVVQCAVLCAVKLDLVCVLLVVVDTTGVCCSVFRYFLLSSVLCVLCVCSYVSMVKHLCGCAAQCSSPSCDVVARSIHLLLWTCALAGGFPVAHMDAIHLLYGD